MKTLARISISPPLAALIIAIVLFLLSGLLPNGYGSDIIVARAQALNILRLGHRWAGGGRRTLGRSSSLPRPVAGWGGGGASRS